MTVFLRFSADGSPARYGRLDGETVTALEGNFGCWSLTDERFRLQYVKVLAPCEPTKAVCLGTNYREVLAAKGQPVPAEPTIFLKPSSAVIGPEEPICHPRVVEKLGYEVELAVVIKQRAKNVRPKEALQYVLGYTVANELTAKDFMGSGPWTKGKGFDTFLPLGPWIVPDLDPGNLPIRARLNGQITQDSNTSDMACQVADAIAYVSSIMTLYPGDVICMGTPPGAGTLKPGDLIEVMIDGIGILRNPVQAG